MEENEVFNHNVCKANISFAKGEFHPSKTDFTHPKGWISLHNSNAVMPFTPQKVGVLEGKSSIPRRRRTFVRQSEGGAKKMKFSQMEENEVFYLRKTMTKRRCVRTIFQIANTLLI